MADESQRVPDLTLDISDRLASLVFDRPDSKVNLLTRDVMMQLDVLLASIADAAARGEVGAVVLRSRKPRNFIAGADIDELAELEGAAAAREISSRGQAIFRRLEALPVTTLAAIRGTCVGGGLELALACDFRVVCADAATRLGLPETRIGILPGLGGTVRLPRLVGLRPALDLILTGAQIRAERAHKIGLVDRVLAAERFDEEIDALAAALAHGEAPLRRSRRPLLRRMLQDGPPARWLIRRLSRRAVMAQTKGHYPAQPAALEATVSGLALSTDPALEGEAETFGRLAATPECKNLIAVFKLTEWARKQQPAGVARTIERGAVVGAGVMGAGIAELFAYQAIPVHVVDVDKERVRSGVRRASGLLSKAALRSGWSEDELRTRTACLVGATDYSGFEIVDFVVEAVSENMEIKRKVFAVIEDHVAATTVVATNTSALSVSELQRQAKRPERVCGLHYFNPPHRMPLVEVVRGTGTSDDALATAFALAARQGKSPVVVSDSPGFVVNRILAAYLTEAGHLLQHGMSIESVDRLMSRFGMPVGPMRLLDEIGLDVVAEVSRTMEDAFGQRFEVAPIMKVILSTGLTGRKGGRGLYVYKGKKVRGMNSDIATMLADGTTGPPPAPQEAEERMVFSMVNEATRALDDGVVDSPKSIDVAMIMGAGFPPFRGGLLRYADQLGLDRIAARLRYYGTEFPRLSPAPSLLERRRFYDT
jgi:3-hydroxyacyl-CoA dehydrogenase/enoyl-CoA hydratase/3-hydroxybutyryl-CoA epimerase